MPTSTPTTETVIQALVARPGATAADLAEATGLGRSTVSKALAALEIQDQAVRETGRRAGAHRLPDRWTARPGRDSDAGVEDPIDEPARDGEGPDAHAVGGPDAPAPEQAAPRADSPGRSSSRLARGALRALVLSFLQARPGEELSPTAVAKALGRSSGAVSNALDKLAGEGVVTQTNETPRRYTHSA